MIPLGRAVRVVVRDHVPLLAGRVYAGQEPVGDAQCPLAVVSGVDWSREPTLGTELHRAELIVTLTDEVTNAPTMLVEIEKRLIDVLTGLVEDVPALGAVVEPGESLPVLAGWRVGHIEALGSKAYGESSDGHRYAHTRLEFEVLIERSMD